MIDIEQEVIAELQAGMQTVYGENFFVLSDRSRKPATLPAAYLEEVNNTIDTRTSDSNSRENHANITFRLSAVSDKREGKKAECKEVFNTADGILTGMGLTRMSKQPIDLNSGTMYRLDGLYMGLADKNKQIIGGINLGS